MLLLEAQVPDVGTSAKQGSPPPPPGPVTCVRRGRTGVPGFPWTWEERVVPIDKENQVSSLGNFRCGQDVKEGRALVHSPASQALPQRRPKVPSPRGTGSLPQKSRGRVSRLS